MKRERLIEILSKVDKEVTKDFTDYDLIDYVTCLKEVHSEQVDEYRWWDIWEDVFEVDSDVYLKYTYAKATGDLTPSELGYEDNGLDDIVEVIKKEITTYTYTEVK